MTMHNFLFHPLISTNPKQSLAGFYVVLLLMPTSASGFFFHTCPFFFGEGNLHAFYFRCISNHVRDVQTKVLHFRNKLLVYGKQIDNDLSTREGAA